MNYTLHILLRIGDKLSILIQQIFRLNSWSLRCENKENLVRKLSYVSYFVTGDFWTNTEGKYHTVKCIFNDKEKGKHITDCTLPFLKSVYFMNYLSTWLSKKTCVYFNERHYFLKIMLKSRSSDFHNSVI